MNIREHIDAGHYDHDDKGRALVPTASEGVVAVIAETAFRKNCMLGWVIPPQDIHPMKIEVHWWQEDGTPYVPVPRLLPPPPRKSVKHLCAVYARDDTFHAGYDSAAEAARVAELICGYVVLLSGEHEVPWDSKSPQS